MTINRLFVGALAAFVVALAPQRVLAQSAENVAVIINDNSEASRRIGEHYAKARALPPANVLHIRTTTEDIIQRDEYLRTIERPVGQTIRGAGLQDRLLYLVLTKGVPLRIAGTTGTTGSVASVDSELTLLYRRLVGTPVPIDGRIENPYYLGDRPLSVARPFTHREHDLYLVTRLDAFTVDQAIALIDRALTPAREGRVILDQRGGGGNGDQWMQLAATRLSEQGNGSRVLLENTLKPARDDSAVLGYYSWGASDPENQVRTPGLRFAPGSIAASLASFDARTFRQPPDTWRPTASPDKSAWFEGSADALIGDLIRDGVTGVAGQVDEAYAFGAVRPEILFPAYLAGFNLAEAFYLSTPALSWQTVIVGDPLLAPFSRKPLTMTELEDAVDQTTGYPGLFGRRRSLLVQSANTEVPAAAVPALVRSQAAIDREDRAVARLALEEVLTLAPRAIGPLVGLAQLEEADGVFDAAVQHYRRVIEIQPDHVVALNNLAYLLAVRQNNPKEALPFALAAAKVQPLNGLILDTVAWIQHLLGNDELAAKLLDAAIRREPSQPEIRLHAALVYMAVGNAARAEVELKEALRIEPALESRNEVQRLRLQLRP